MNNSHEHAFWTHYSQNRSPVGKISQYIHPGENSTWTSHTLQKCGVLRSTRILTLDQLPAPVPWTSTAWGSPLSAVTESTLLNLWFSSTHLQKECLRPDPSSSAWNQDQQHEDDFPGLYVTLSFTLHTHTPCPVSSLPVSESCPAWWYLISEGLNWFNIIPAHVCLCKSHLI